MDDVKSQSNTVRLRLKGDEMKSRFRHLFFYFFFVAMEKKIEEEQKGDSRHSADLRIYKAQVNTLAVSGANVSRRRLLACYTRSQVYVRFGRLQRRADGL